MARKQGNPAPADLAPPAEDAKRRQVTIDEDLVKKARVIASHLGITLPDYVNNRLRPIVERELPGILEELGYSVKTGETP